MRHLELGFAVALASTACGGTYTTRDSANLDENAWTLTSENDLQSGALDRALDHYESGEFGYFNGVPHCDGKGACQEVEISYAIFRDTSERGAIVVVNGRAESHAKYAEWIYDMRDRGYSLYLIDHRGQGRSSRLLDDRDMGHVQHFDHYVEDLHTFVEDVVNAEAHDNLFALGHSMGGAILGRYVIERPAQFDAYAFSSPMFGINTAVWQWIAEGLVKIGSSESYAPGKGPYDPDARFAGNSHTNSAARYGMMYDIVARYPETALGGPTNHWVDEAFDVGDEIKERASEMTLPMLLIQPVGDSVVSLKAQDEVCARAPRCELASISVSTPHQGKQRMAQHETLIEVDATRSWVMRRILDHFRTYETGTE